MFRGAFVDNALTKIEPALLEKFLDKLAPPFVTTMPLTIETPSCDDNQQLNSLFSLTELKSVLSYLVDSAPGCDGIPYSFLVNSSD